MASAKTTPTGESVEEYLSARATPEQLEDCKVLLDIFQRVTGSPPTMWGPSIVGFGSYRYPLANGKTGECCATGFAVRGRELTIYVLGEGASRATLLRRLGKHRVGKACLYFKRVTDLDLSILEMLLVESLDDLRRRYDTKI